MRRPNRKLILFFLVSLGAGYAVSVGLMFALGAEYRFYGFVPLTLVAVLVALILVIAFDKPFELGMFEWPPEKPPAPKKPLFEPETAASGEEGAEIAPSKVIPGAIFPYEVPTDHWEVDFNDSKQSYEGTALPVWLLAGWAAFILWAIIYLIVGLPGTL
ncbi:MAG: hypothetical protein D6796_02930 [Caldilineae bacterium]|nr:MAG: hypothetical protein D6796_02930 [Caldilineae bacterium]